MEKKKLTYLNAGHCEFLVFYCAKKEIQKYAASGLPVGIARDRQTSYIQADIFLSPGDVVVFYTDGVIEAKNRQNEEFGMERLEAIVMQNCSRESASIVEIIRNNVEEHAQGCEQHDDITVVVLKQK